MELYDYQADTLNQIFSPPQGVTRQLAVLATGGGKTLVFGTAIKHVLQDGGRALVLAHRKELLEQAAAEINKLDPSLPIEFEQASKRATRSHGMFEDQARGVVVGSVDTLGGKRLEEWPRDAFRYVVVDEAHHATSPSYLDILRHFQCLDDTPLEKRVPLLGVTATPNRTDGVGLGAVFQRIAAVYGIKELVARKRLVQPMVRRVTSSTDLTGVATSAGDYNLKQLQRAVNKADRNGLIVGAYQKWGEGRKAVVFCCGVEHAKEVARYFVAAGISAESIDGDMNADDRAATLARHKSGETLVLTNFGVLVEGYNDPSIACIVLARPTKSMLVETQMTGRGLRSHPGKVDCLIIDVQDVTKAGACVSAAMLAGLPVDFDAEGTSIFACKKAHAQLDPRLAAQALSPTQIQQIIEREKNRAQSELVELQTETGVPPEVERFSRLQWQMLSVDEYAIRIKDGPTYSLTADTLGRWAIQARIYQGFGKPTKVRMIHPGIDTLQQAFEVADSGIASNHGNVMVLLDRNAPWRKDPASPNQIGWLNRLGVKFEADISKGDAKTLLDRAFAQARR